MLQGPQSVDLDVCPNTCVVFWLVDRCLAERTVVQLALFALLQKQASI